MTPSPTTALRGKAPGTPQLAWRLRLLMAAWTAESSADPVAWTAANPAWGQCATTACVVQDILGGDIVWGEARPPQGGVISHYWNRVNGQDIDLTRRQFSAGAGLRQGGPKTCGHASTRDYVLSFPATEARYKALHAAYGRLVEVEHFRTLVALAHLSPDRSTRIGCVIADPTGKVLATGTNRFTAGLQPTERHHARPAKYLFTEHAERCAFYAAARAGVSLRGGTIYVRGLPCADCARGVVESGLRCVVSSGTMLNGRWEASQEAGREILASADVAVRIANGLPADMMAALHSLAVDAPAPDPSLVAA